MQTVESLVSELKNKTYELIEIVENQFSNLDAETLNYKESAEKWSIAECLEHLNRYNAFYNPEISAKIKKNIPQKNQNFKSNWLGNYCVNMVRENPKKQKTLKHMNPSNSEVSQNVVKQFIDNQEELLKLLEKSEHVDWTKTKIRIEFAKFMKLRLGDAFQFVIYHQERHIQQALRALEKCPQKSNAEKLIV